jgi:aarF domain-containing kinase
MDISMVHGYLFYNLGDPHPGNIMLLDNGKIGLIDYGQVKVLTEKSKRQLAEFVLALADKDRPRVLKLMRNLGFETEKNDEDVAYETAMLVFDKDDPETLKGKSRELY